MSTGTLKKGQRRDRGSGPNYAVPALEKGLEILECLAGHGDYGFTQTQIAEHLGKSKNEIFRVLSCLTACGYIQRGPGDNNYRLTNKLFELAHQFPPTNRLVELAMPQMRSFAEKARQSCHLAVLRQSKAVIIANVDSPALITLSVRAGSVLPAHESTSGRVLSAFEPEDQLLAWLAEMKASLKPKLLRELTARIETIQEQGYETCTSPRIPGVLDISVPVLDSNGHSVASLTAPCLQLQDGDADAERIRKLAQQAASAIEASIGAALNPDL